MPSSETVQPEGTPPPVVILNPVGNRGRSRKLRQPLERALAGNRGELLLTSAPRDAEKIAELAASERRPVVAVGGDGTIAEVATGILRSGNRVPLGIVPAGSGNDYAYEALRLPRKPLTALEVALRGNPVPVDVGQVNGQYFVNALGVGIDANIAASAERLKRAPLLRGQALYWTASLGELLFRYSRCPQLTVQVDGEPQSERPYALAAISIGPTYGGGFRINPTADPTDGFFDLCTLSKPAWLRALRLLPLVERGKHLSTPEAHHQLVRHVVMESRTPIYAHRDGEVFTASRFEARILPSALLVRVSSPLGPQAPLARGDEGGT